MRFTKAKTAPAATAHDCFEIRQCLATGAWFVTEKTHPAGRITTKTADLDAAERLVEQHQAQHDAAYHQH